MGRGSGKRQCGPSFSAPIALAKGPAALAPWATCHIGVWRRADVRCAGSRSACLHAGCSPSSGELLSSVLLVSGASAEGRGAQAGETGARGGRTQALHGASRPCSTARTCRLCRQPSQLHLGCKPGASQAPPNAKAQGPPMAAQAHRSARWSWWCSTRRRSRPSPR